MPDGSIRSASASSTRGLDGGQALTRGRVRLHADVVEQESASEAVGQPRPKGDVIGRADQPLARGSGRRHAVDRGQTQRHPSRRRRERRGDRSARPQGQRRRQRASGSIHAQSVRPARDGRAAERRGGMRRPDALADRGRTVDRDAKADQRLEAGQRRRADIAHRAQIAGGRERQRGRHDHRSRRRARSQVDVVHLGAARLRAAGEHGTGEAVGHRCGRDGRSPRLRRCAIQPGARQTRPRCAASGDRGAPAAGSRGRGSARTRRASSARSRSGCPPPPGDGHADLDQHRLVVVERVAAEQRLGLVHAVGQPLNGGAATHLIVRRYSTPNGVYLYCPGTPLGTPDRLAAAR